MKETEKKVQTTLHMGKTKDGKPIEVPVNVGIRVVEHDDGRRDTIVRVPIISLKSNRPEDRKQE